MTISDTRELKKACVRLLKEASARGDIRAREQLAWLQKPRGLVKLVGLTGDPVPIGPPGVWRLWMEDWHPCSLNKWDGSHWATRKRLKEEDAWSIGVESWRQQIKPADRMRIVTPILYYPTMDHWHDADNIQKSLYDALKKAKMIIDDGPRWCVQEKVRQGKGDKGTLVILEDC